MGKEDLRVNDLAAMKGYSSWLTIESEKFVLNKREVFAAVNLRYRWPMKYLSSSWPCGKTQGS